MSLFLYADPTRSRCKPQSRSLQIEFCEFRQRFCPGSGRLLVFTLLLRGVSPG